jgi:hypothetical protein
MPETQAEWKANFPLPNPPPEERVSQGLPQGNSNTLRFAEQRTAIPPLPWGEGRVEGELRQAQLPHIASRISKTSLGVAKTKVLAGNPIAERIWKTTEHTEHTEKRRFSSVYSEYSVVSQSNEIAAKLVAILGGRS